MPNVHKLNNLQTKVENVKETTTTLLHLVLSSHNQSDRFYLGKFSRCYSRSCTGACLRAAAQNWGELGLGPTPHEPPAAGLAPAAPMASQPPRIQSPPLRLLHVCICI